jgi:hypothetical protein
MSLLAGIGLFIILGILCKLWDRDTPMQKELFKSYEICCRSYDLTKTIQGDPVEIQKRNQALDEKMKRDNEIYKKYRK